MYMDAFMEQLLNSLCRRVSKTVMSVYLVVGYGRSPRKTEQE